MKKLEKLVEYVQSLTDELHKLGLEMIKETGCRSKAVERGRTDFLPTWR